MYRYTKCLIFALSIYTIHLYRDKNYKCVSYDIIIYNIHYYVLQQIMYLQMHFTVKLCFRIL